MTTRPAFNR